MLGSGSKSSRRSKGDGSKIPYALRSKRKNTNVDKVITQMSSPAIKSPVVDSEENLSPASNDYDYSNIVETEIDLMDSETQSSKYKIMLQHKIQYSNHHYRIDLNLLTPFLKFSVGNIHIISSWFIYLSKQFPFFFSSP